MKLPGLKAGVSLGLAGFAGLPPLRSGRHSSPGLKAWGFLADLIKLVPGKMVFSRICKKYRR
jgi:hypothetical protein